MKRILLLLFISIPFLTSCQTLQNVFNNSTGNFKINGHLDSLKLDSLTELSITNKFVGHTFTAGVKNLSPTIDVPLLFSGKDGIGIYISGAIASVNRTLLLPDTNGIAVLSVNNYTGNSKGNIILPQNNIIIVNKGFLLPNATYIGLPVGLNNTFLNQIVIVNFPQSGHIESYLPISVKYSGVTNINTPVFTFIGVANPANPNSVDKNVIRVQTGDMINGAVNGTLSYSIGESYSLTSDGTGYIVIKHSVK